MARTAQSGSQSNKKKAASPAQKNARKSAAAQSRADAAQAQPRDILDERSRRDIWGVVCAVLALALFIIAVMPARALVSSWLSNALHLGFGVGAYIMPVFLLLVSVTMFARSGETRVPTRVAIGLMLLFLGVLIMFSIYTPGMTIPGLRGLFAQDNLVSQGGYVGAVVAWLLLTLLGQMVSTIIVAGLMIISLIVIGFSISRFFDRIEEHRERRAAEMASLEAAPAPRFEPAPQRAPRKRQPREPSAPTRLLGRGELETTLEPEPRKLRKATRSIATMAYDEGDLPEEPKQMTRKLGDRSQQKTQRIESGSAAKRVTQATAAPKPSEDFELPPMSLLHTSKPSKADRESAQTLRETAMLLQETLADFGVDAQVVDWVAGPTVTLFKIDLPSGVRVSKVTNLTDDIALALAAPGVRIFSPVPGTNYVGIEVPNINRQNVLLGDVIKDAPAGPLQIAIGKDVEGNCIVTDLAKMPHLLIGGTTGSGKSVAINGMIMTMLMRATPAEVRFIMIDPKRVEFAPYNDIPHLYVPVVTECKEAASALSWAVAEMELRLKKFSKKEVAVRNIGQYNQKVQQGLVLDEDGNPVPELPYIVIVIDELADLMMNVGKEVEFSISRLAQLARAAGIHMIIATQRPSTNVVTGLIKANITNRIAFNVASGIDSRVILDQTGAENLIGKGDMLMSKPEYQKPQRLQGCWVTEEEIESVVERLKAQGEPDYHQEILQSNVIQMGSTMPDGSGGRASGPDDPLLWEAAEIVVSSGLGSTSNIQRRLSVGYSRAGRIMDMLEEKGVVGPPNGSKPREVLVDEMELETLKAFEMNDSM